MLTLTAQKFISKTFITSLMCASALTLLACQDAAQSSANKAANSNGSNGSHSISAAKPVEKNSVQKFSAEAFYQTTSFGMASGAGHTFGPVSGDLLVTSDQSGVFNAYRLNPKTKALTPLTTSTTNAITAVSWFPDDERLLYTSDGGGDELNHIYVRETGGSIRDLTPGENIKASFLGWSADGSAFYLTSNARDAAKFDVYKYDAKTYESKMAFQNDGKEINAISPDGRWLGLTKNNSSADSDVYLVDLQNSGAPKLITPHKGEVAHSAYDFTADSQELIYATDEFGDFSQAWTYNVNDSKKSKRVAADWDVSSVTESPSGKYRVVSINDDGSTKITMTDLTSNQTVNFKDLPEGNVRSIRFSADETQLAFIMNGDRAPSNIHIASLDSLTQRPLTSALNGEITADTLVEGQVVRYKSYDGLEIPGILYKPHGASAANPVPAMIMVHGGPGGQNRKGYRAQVQHMVNHGYAVYAMNNRGSSGYGKTFFHLDDKKHGDVDLKDVIWSKKYMTEQDWVNGEKIGIIGGSYGGYMVAAALAFEPEEFDVGINIFGVTNWERTLKSIPPWWGSFREQLYDEMGDPATDQARHRAISPLFHAKNIVKPMLVVQGANDPRVLQVESDELVAAVEKNGVPIKYIVFPDEGHGFRKRDNRITASNAYVEFLDKYLK